MSNQDNNNNPAEPDDPPPDQLNLKVTDTNNNEMFFKIKRTTKLGKLMAAYCDRQGKTLNSVRFLFEGSRVQPTDTPDTLELQENDTIEAHQEQIGGRGKMSETW